MAPRSNKPKFTSAELQRARDYVREEPGFTAPFMAWELGWPLETARAVTERLLSDGLLSVVEPPSRPFAAVYAYRPPNHLSDTGAPRIWGEGQDVPEADLAAPRGEIVPHTRQRGPSDTPGRNRARQERGVRVRRPKQGT